MGIEPTTYSLGRVSPLLKILSFPAFWQPFGVRAAMRSYAKRNPFRRSHFPMLRYELAKPEPAFLYSDRGGLNTSSTRAPSGPARIVWGTLPGVRQKSPFFTGISWSS